MGPAPANVAGPRPASVQPPLLRELLADDHDAVLALLRRHGWPLRSRAGWDWGLLHNPARVELGAAAGWVLEVTDPGGPDGDGQDLVAQGRGATGTGRQDTRRQDIGKKDIDKKDIGRQDIVPHDIGLQDKGEQNSGEQRIGDPAAGRPTRRCVGFLGNIPQAYHGGLPRLWGATCTSLLVEPDYRPYALLLMRAFAAQPGAHFVHSATANPQSTSLYRLFKFRPGTVASLDHALRWVADDAAFVAHALQRVVVPQASRHHLPRWALGLGWLAAPALHFARHVTACATPPRARLGLAGYTVRRVAAADLARGARVRQQWDVWAAALAQEEVSEVGLSLDRSADALRWRLGDPDLLDQLALWSLHDPQQQMCGLCLLRELGPHAPGTPKAEMMDWAVLQATPPGAQSQLLQTALLWAAQRGLPMLDAKRYSGRAAQQLAALGAARAALAPQANWLLPRPAAAAPLPADLLAAGAWNMTGAHSDDWFCSHDVQVRSDRQPWVDDAAMRADDAAEAAESAQAAQAAQALQAAEAATADSAPQRQAQLLHQVADRHDLGRVEEQHVELSTTR